MKITKLRASFKNNEIRGPDAFADFDTVKIKPSLKRPNSSDLELGINDITEVFLEPVKLCQLGMRDHSPSSLKLPVNASHRLCSKVAVGECSHKNYASCSR